MVLKISFFFFQSFLLVKKYQLETPIVIYFFKVELLADLSCCIVAKDVGLVHELCGSNDLSQVQIRKKVMVKALAA